MSALDAADIVAAQSNCVRRQVGAVLLDPSGRAMAYGFNHVVGVESCKTVCPRARRSYEEVPAFSNYSSGDGRCDAVHAERDALNKMSGANVRGWTLAISCAPCPQCAALIESLGLKAIWPECS